VSRKGWTYPACSWSRAKFDAIIIATGQAGPSLAGRLVDAGMKIAVIERKLFGVTCVNTGRMPTKTLIAGAYAVKIAPRAADSASGCVARSGTRNQCRTPMDTEAHACELPTDAICQTS
jgi:pyruvate/2-oxoglutarate dehydrogenase complex dihydrolipoamide dehydrogenase (E3) component